VDRKGLLVTHKYDGKMIDSLVNLTDDKLRGAQLPLLGPKEKVAYRVQTRNGTLVLCDVCLEALRKVETAVLTGKIFGLLLCDGCGEDEMERK
jgi:hypothetical protein